MTRCKTLAFVVLVACSAPVAPRHHADPKWVGDVSIPKPQVVDAGVAPAGPPPPGCKPGDAATRIKELEAIAGMIGDAKPPNQILDALRATVAKPCLAHVAPVLDLPASTTLPFLREAWTHLEYTLKQATAELDVWRGHKQLMIPRQIIPELADKPKRELAWLACPANDASCDRVAAYIARAETAFDVRLKAQEARNDVAEHDWGGSVRTVIPVGTCDGTRRHDEDHKPTTFEEWATCAANRAQRNRRYAEHRFRALDRGWLVMRGRRGHYQAADEIRTYDLATGAAYIVQYQTGVIMMPDQVALNEKGPQTMTGRVAPDQLREIAFVLLTRAAVVELRTSTAYADIPPKIPLELSRKPFDREQWGRTSWRSSDQTTIDYAWFDDVKKTGSFIWPSAHDWIDDHVAELVRIMEAGMVKGCAPAKLPPAAKLAGGAAKVSSIDADAKTLNDHYAMLDKALEKLRPAACPGAK